MGLVLMWVPNIMAREGLTPPPLELVMQERVSGLPTSINPFPSTWQDHLVVLFRNPFSVQDTLPEGLLHCVINKVKL